MQHKFTPTKHLKRAALTLLALIFTCATPSTAFAQNLAEYAFTTGVDQNQWITLSNNATQIVASGLDDACSSLTNIGFNFTFGDGTYTQFWANSNGIFSFNSTPTTNYSNQFNPSNCTNNQPKICGISRDMSTGTDGYVKYELTGTSPNRVLVCEFYLFGNGSNIDYPATIKWQVQLHESTSKVVIVYGASSSDPYFFQIGLSQSGSDIWTVDPSTHEATHLTEGVETEYEVWPGENRYYEFAPLPFTISDDGNTYTINSAEGWGMFCDTLTLKPSGYFTGKTVKLGANISITQSAGSDDHRFMGTFDGQEYTLDVDITDTGEQGTAPFRFISNATIRNLHVTGTVTGTTHAAGLVGKASAGTILIENCLVEANVNSTVGNNRHCGGIVGHGFGGNNPVDLTLRNCVYAGTITCDNNYIGGLQGWSDGNTLTLENCLFAGNYQGTATGTAAFHPIALHNTGKTTNLTATNVFTAVAPTATNANFIAADGIKTTGRTTAPDNLGSQEASYSFMDMTVYENGLYYDGLYYVAPTLSTDNSGAYLINNEDDWTNFCDALYNNGTWNRFSGQTVKLGADISVSRMAGYDNHDFLGTFDGNHNTLTFTATATASYLAPFRNVLGNSTTDRAVIRDLNVVTNITAHDERHMAGLIALVWGYVDVTNCNVTVDITATKGSTNTDLYPAGIASQVVKDAQISVSGCTVDGTISTDGKYAGGIIGIAQGSASITNSLSSVTINSSTEGDGTHGGLVGVQGNYDGKTITIEGCVFNGQLLGASTHSCGGFLGWRSQTVTISNSLFAPVQVTINTTDGSTPCATFVRNGDSNTTITNCYYTDTLGTAQGTKVYSISKGQYVTTLEINGDATQSYDVSGLSFYSAGLSLTQPLPEGEEEVALYAAASDVVSLTLGNTVPEDYFLGYSVSPTEATLSGSGNPYTLTMPDADVVITANTNFPSVSYIDENGETQQCTNYIWLTGTETTLGAEGQETWCVVHSTLNYSHGIQLLGNTHIILCDGAAMNIGSSESPVSGSFPKNEGFSGSGNNLSLYAQSGNTGALTIYSQSCSFDVKDLTIAGGNVNATSLSSVPVIGCTNNLTVCRSSLEIHTNGPAVQANDVTLSNVTANINSSNSVGFVCSNFAVDNSQLTVNTRGEAIGANNGIILSNVTANLNSSNAVGLICSNFAVDNSQLTVTAPNPAIQASNVITLGCTAATDFIKATSTNSLPDSYIGTVKIADGQTLYAGTNAYTGTLTDAQRQAIGGQKLTNVAPPTYDYIDLDGTGATHTAVVINADNMPTALSGWYIVQGTVNYTNTINLGGDTHIILADNAVMNVTVTGGYNYGIRSTSGNNYSFFVYGQTGQSGELNVTSNDYACYIYGGDITIAGGKVTASGSTGIFAQYNNNGGNVTIKNATVTATASYAAIRSINGDITIDNSNVTATSTVNNGIAIFAENGDIIFRNGGKTTASNSNNRAIYAKEGDITITDCEVEAIGSTGIYAYSGNNSGDVTIQNATVTATASFAAIYSNNGDITIDNSNVTATATVNNGIAIFAENGDIIFRNGGKTTASNSNYIAIYANEGDITITDCEVEAIGSTGIWAYSGNNSSDVGNVTIQNATVTASGSSSSFGIYTENGSVTIKGGQVSAIGNIYGIYAQNSNDNITLGWTNPTDYIYANKYYAGGTLSIAEGKAFIDEDGNPYSGTVANVSGAYAINGKWLYPNTVSLFTKTIVAHHTEEGVNYGWYLIASPLAGETNAEAVAHLINTTNPENFDLYRFDPSNEGSEWVNYKADNFSLVNGHGYLYASNDTKVLCFAGSFITDTESVAVGLAYDASDDHKCWNLVGNPFPCEATINKPYYMLNADGATINPVAISGDTPIPACTAVFVKGESSDDRVVFSKVSAPASSAPIGAIDGLFSVGADKQVYFSQGNLQYQPSTATWRFAPNQYDLLVKPEDTISFHPVAGYYADVTSQYTEDYTGWIDLFGWGTSGWNSGAIAYMPYDPSCTAADFYPGGDYNNDLTGTCANADWAWYNPISNGGNAANQWRTLTHDEWAYLFNTREGAASKYGHGSVDGVNGMIILPDNWTLPDGCSFTPGNSDWTNSYTTTKWAAMEAAGAVFLPAAGQRSFGTFVNKVGNLGRYWSSTHRNNTAAYDVWFHSDFISELDTQAYYSNRSMGYSVRPVQDAQ